MAMLRILLADDHDIVRRGLRELLEQQPGWFVCAEAANGREAVELALEHRPQVAILDLTMPELNGLEATRRIRQALPETQVLIFTMHDSEELLRGVLRAGARGYLLKSDAARQLVPAVDSLAQRKAFFSGRVSEVLLEGFLDSERRRSDELGIERLTSREREIVQLLAEGKSNKEVARALDLSVKTVETHRGAVMRKLDLHSIADLVRFAIRNHIIAP
jgi:DNA-binding NarL/FixJ family response regulator